MVYWRDISLDYGVVEYLSTYTYFILRNGDTNSGTKRSIKRPLSFWPTCQKNVSRQNQGWGSWGQSSPLGPGMFIISGKPPLLGA